MHTDDLERLYDYGYWATRRLFAALAPLTDEQFTQIVPGTQKSIRNTLVHVLSAEWGWLDRCGGHKRGPRLVAEHFATAEVLIAGWRQFERHMRDFLAELMDEDLGRQVHFTLGDGPERSLPLGDLLEHAAIHGAHHRGQVALLLGMIGHPPGNFDVLEYDLEKRGSRVSAARNDPVRARAVPERVARS
jgi:uncharacterized damage-inducible protein DinB